MTAEEYLRAKNALVKEFTGKALVYEEDIVPHNVPMERFEPAECLTDTNCTYCVISMDAVSEIVGCENCPIYKSDRGCMNDNWYTYDENPYQYIFNKIGLLKKSKRKDFENRLMALGKEFEENYTPVENPEFAYGNSPR